MKKVKKVKKVLVVLAGGAFIALVMFNVKLGLSDYDKTSIISFTLEALTSENGGSEVSPCLESHTAEQGKKQTFKAYCYSDVNGTDTFEGKTYDCTKSDYSNHYCNKVTCKSLSHCYTSTTKNH
jgi:hypothetical protein